MHAQPVNRLQSRCLLQLRCRHRNDLENAAVPQADSLAACLVPAIKTGKEFWQPLSPAVRFDIASDARPFECKVGRESLIEIVVGYRVITMSFGGIRGII